MLIERKTGVDGQYDLSTPVCLFGAVTRTNKTVDILVEQVSILYNLLAELLWNGRVE